MVSSRKEGRLPRDGWETDLSSFTFLCTGNFISFVYIAFLIYIIQFRKQWCIYLKPPCSSFGLSSNTTAPEEPSLDPEGKGFPDMWLNYCGLVHSPPHDSNLGSVLFNAVNPVTGTIPRTFQELTKHLLTKWMKRQVPKEATKPRAHNRSRQDSLMSARQWWPGRREHKVLQLTFNKHGKADPMPRWLPRNLALLPTAMWSWANPSISEPSFNQLSNKRIQPD